MMDAVKLLSVFFIPHDAPLRQAAYRKVELVPFSEATPLRGKFPWLQQTLGRTLELTPGAGVRLISFGGLKIQPLICFESGFAGLIRQGVGRGADLLVETSNDGWFAARDAELKHLGMGVFRTVEARRPLVRCSNTGGGAYVLASGELTPGTLTPHGRSAAILAAVTCPETVTVYARLGDSWLWGLALFVLWGVAKTAFKSGVRMRNCRFKCFDDNVAGSTRNVKEAIRNG